jgi:hypothetical protein
MLGGIQRQAQVADRQQFHLGPARGGAVERGCSATFRVSMVASLLVSACST